MNAKGIKVVNTEKIEEAAKKFLQVVEEETGLEYKQVTLHWMNRGNKMPEVLQEPPTGLDWEHLMDFDHKDAAMLYTQLMNVSFKIDVEGRMEEDNENI